VRLLIDHSVLNPLRPKEWRVQIVGQDGKIVCEAQFATQDEAKRFAYAKRGEPDVTITRFTDLIGRN